MDEEPEAVVEKRGRWLHLIYISIGLSQYGPNGHGWYVLRAKRAKKKAKKELLRYNRKFKVPKELVIIRTEDVS